MHKIWIAKQRSLGTTNNGNNGAVQRFLHLFYMAGHTYVFKTEDGDENGCELRVSDVGRDLTKRG